MGVVNTCKKRVWSSALDGSQKIQCRSRGTATIHVAAIETVSLPEGKPTQVVTGSTPGPASRGGVSGKHTEKPERINGSMLEDDLRFQT